MKKLLVIMIMSLGFLLTACVPDISGDTNVDSFNTTETAITDSYNTYTTEQEQLIEDGYVPDEAGVCSVNYFWCSIEQLCLPAVDGASCPIEHTDEEEAEAQEIIESSKNNNNS